MEMIIDLEPISIAGLDCSIACMLTLANWQIKEYQLAFWSSWEFNYDREFSLFGERLDISMSTVLYNLKTNYFCEELELQIGTNITENIRKSIQNNMPIIVALDSYYCPWSDNYKEKHVNHVIVISGICKNGFYAVDTMPIKENVFIGKNDIANGIISAKVVRFSKKESKNCIDFLNNVLNRKQTNQEILKMECFNQDIKECSWNQEFDFQEYVWAIPIMRSVRRIYGSRIQFLECVKYFKSENIMLCEYIEDIFKPIITEWGILLNILYKARISNVYDNVGIRITNRMKKILEIEKCVIGDLKDKLINKKILSNEKVIKKMYLPIKCYFNSVSHFYETKDFIRRTPFPSIVYDNKGLVLMKMHKDVLDCGKCMVCKKQSFDITSDKIVRIHLIGYGTWRNQSECIRIFYEHENYEDVEIQLSDWCLGASFGEEVLWRGKFDMVNGNDIYNGYIYDSVVRVNGKRKISKFRLPENEKMILFGIVLEIRELY